MANEYILIEYSNSVDFGDIIYHNTFSPRVYLNADVSKPEYELVEEGIENGEGEFSPTFQKWSKKYSIVFYAQEFLTDALTLMALHDTINVTLKSGESSNVIDIEVTPKWDANIECWAEVTITFTTSYILRTTCDENMTVGCQDPVYVGGLTPYAIPSSMLLQTTDVKWTDPIANGVTNGDVAFFYDTETTYRYYGTNKGVYVFTNGAWVSQPKENGDFIEITGSTDYVYIVQSLPNFIKVPYIVSVTDEGGGDATIVAVAEQIESNFFQVQYDDGGGWANVGDPALASEFLTGYTVSTGAGVNIDFRINWYTHSCTYGTGNEVTQTIT